jgi:predicted nucleic acid-binding protein
MRVVDTSAWIECLKGSALGRTLANELSAPAAWLAPTIVQLELAKGALRESDAEKAEDIIVFTSTNYTVIPLDTAIAAFAAELSTRHKLATADAIVYATAQLHDAELLTCVRHFENLPSVRYLPNPTH